MVCEGRVMHMNKVSKTAYIPLYGKAYVSRKGLFLTDRKSEEIWAKEGFPLHGKSRSKWLAYYMGIRSAVFDSWLREKLAAMKDAIVIHIGCGMDGRVERIGACDQLWYDVDFPELIRERQRYYHETPLYRMVGADVRDGTWLVEIPSGKSAIIVMEGLSMYLSLEELKALMESLGSHFKKLAILMDCYTVFAARISKYKNPINDVGVTEVHGVDKPEALSGSNILFLREHEMTPPYLIDQLKGIEGLVFRKLYAGSFSKKLYRLYEYEKV